MAPPIGPSTVRNRIGTSSRIRPHRKAHRTSCWSSSTTPGSGTRAPSADRSRRRPTHVSRRQDCATTGSTSRRCAPPPAPRLLTGRNNHAVGFGSIGEFAGGFPGYSALLPRDCAPLPRILRDNGYSTAAIGKWHLTPDGDQGPAGPFDRWPNGWGFDYFYGILGGGSSQWDPCLAENQKIIGTDPRFYDDDDPYYFPDAMADHTIEWLHGVRAQDAHKPFFVYFSTGCSHAPHHVASEWADRYTGMFDQGWDKLREQTFARQKELGVIPPDAKLTPRDEAFPAWDDLSDELKRFYAAPDGGLRGVLRERRPQRRSRDRGDRRAG